MPTIDYPTDIGIANYFSHDVQCSILVGIDKFACRRAEEPSLSSSSKVFFVLADSFKSQCITFTCVAFFMFHEFNNLYPNCVSSVAVLVQTKIRVVLHLR